MKHLRIPTLLLLAASVSPAQDRASLMERVPAGWENVVHVQDVLPVLERTLASPALEEVWKEAAAGLAAIDPALRGMAPRFLLGPLGLAKDQLPVEVVLATPESTTTDLGAVLRAVVQAFYGWLVVEQGGFDAPQLANFRGAAADLAEGIAAPDAYLAARARSAEAARGWFRAVADAVESAPFRRYLDDEIGDDAITIELDVGTALGRLADEGNDVWDRLDQMGMFPADHDATTRLKRSATALRIVLRIERRGDVLEARLGDVPAGAPAQDRPGRRDDPAQLFYAQWNTLGLVEHASAAFEALDDLDSDAYQHVSTIMLDRHDRVLAQLEDLWDQSGTGWMSLTVREDALEVESWMPLDPLFEWTPPSVRYTGLARFVPEGASSVMVTGFFTLDEWLYLAYDEVTTAVDRLAAETWERGMDPLSSTFEDASTFLLVDLGELFLFLAGEDSAVFEDGTLVVVDGDGMATGVPAIAAVGLPESRAAGREFVDRLADAIRAGVGPAEGDAVVEVAFRGGTTALVLQLPGAPADAAGLEDAAIALHAVVTDEALVLSTRASLTRVLLAARDRAGAAASGSDLVTEVRSTGAAIAGLVRQGAMLLPGEDRQSRQFRAVFDALAVFAGLAGGVTQTDRLEDEGLTTRTVIRLRD